MSGHRIALVVAIDQYQHPGLRQLVAPAADAEALAGVLGDRELGGFDVEVLHNVPASTISERLEDVLTERQPSDLVVLHFSCHGLKDDAGELYLAATNTVPTRLASTAVDSVLVNRLMRRSRARRVVLLLDCCYGGAFERGMIARAGGDIDVGDQFATGPLGGGRGRVVITASSAMEYAFEGARLAEDSAARPSVFTAALVEGLATGDADRDNDGNVALGELYDYVYDRVREHSPHQTPCKWEFGLQGELYLARNPRRRIVPGRLRSDLAELVEHPNAEVRLTAVQLLDRAARDSDLSRAAAARRALIDLADDDSRRVSVAASRALQLTGLRLSIPSLDLGQVVVGGTSSSSVVKLEGTPLALESLTLTVTGPIDARLDGARVSITWAPKEPGSLSAALTVSGPAGEVRLPVSGRAVAPATLSRTPEEQVEPRKPTVESPNSPARGTFGTIDTTPNRFEVLDDAPPATDAPVRAAERTPDRTQLWRSRFKAVRPYVGLLVLVAIVVIAALSQSGGSPTSPAPAPVPASDTPAVAQCGTVNLAVNPWVGYEADAAVYAYVAKTKLNCNVVNKDLKEEASWAGFGTGEVDLILENWGHPDLTKQYITDQKAAVDLGLTGNKGIIGWYVPPWLAQEHPDITDWNNLNKYADQFKTTESGGQGQLLDGDPSFVTNDEALVKNLNLNYKVVYAGSEAALIEAFRQAEANKTPLIGYFYEPHWFFQEMKLARVNLPPYTDGCDADPAKIACDYPQYDLNKIASTKFANSGSPAAEMAKKFQWTNDDQNAVARSITVDKLSADDAAKKWVDANPDKVNAWLPAKPG